MLRHLVVVHSSSEEIFTCQLCFYHFLMLLQQPYNFIQFWAKRNPLVYVSLYLSVFLHQSVENREFVHFKSFLA